MKTKSQAPAGAFTKVVNPAKPVGLTSNSERKMQVQKPASPGAPRRPNSRRRRRNGLEGMVALLLPLAAGGGIGYLEAKNPDWWKKIDGKIKAVVFAAVAFVAQKRGMREAAGGASVLCGIYAARAGLEYWASRPKGNLAGMLGATGLSMDQVDAEMQIALDRARRAQIAGPVAALEPDALGALNNDDDVQGMTEVERGIDTAYRQAA